MLEPVIQDKRHWWNREDIFLLILLAAAFFLPGLHRIPLFDRDEPRFAVAARTMLETGDFIVPRFNGMLRPDKPPLVYWLMDLGYLATGGPSELGARLPSAVCGMFTLIVTYFMVGARFGRQTGFFSAMMLGTCALFVVESRMATADSTMILCIVICMACAWAAWDAAGGGGSGGAGESAGGRGGAREGGGRLPRADYLPDRSGDRAMMVLDHLPPPRRTHVSFGKAMAFWVALAAGTLAKGVPLVFVLVPMIVLSLCTGALPAQLREWRSHFHLTGRRVGVALAIAGIMTAFVIGTTSAHALLEYRLWAVVVAILLIAMILTPGLPGVLARCLWNGNWGWWRQLRPAMGIPLLVVLVGWWVVWAGMATHWQLLVDMVGNHFLNRSMGPLLHSLGITIPDTTPGGTQDAMKSYGRPPGFHTLFVWALYWPWSILIVPAAYHTIRRLRGKTPIAIDPRPYQFLVAWIVPMWILLELARGKLFHYPLPTYVPLSILCADALVQSWHRLTDVLAARWFDALRWVTMAIWLGMAVAVIFLARLDADPDVWKLSLAVAAPLACTGVLNAWSWRTIWWPPLLILGWGTAIYMAGAFVLPNLPNLQVSRLAGLAMAQRLKEDPGLHLGVCDYEDATLVFYSGHNVERFDGTRQLLARVPFAPQADPAKSPYVLVVSDEVLRNLKTRNPPVAFVPVPRVDLPDNNKLTDIYGISGFNTANFKPVSVMVITNLVPDAPAASAAMPATRPEAATQH